MQCTLALVLGLAAVSAPENAPSARLIPAAPLRAGPVRTPRQLFNTGLGFEEKGEFVQAAQHYLSARLSPVDGLADRLYARGAALRLVRMLAGRDDDAATAAAMLLREDLRPPGASPLVRSLLGRMEIDASLQMRTGTIRAIRYDSNSNTVTLEVICEDGEEAKVTAPGPIGPFSSGDPVHLLLRRQTDAKPGWTLVAAGDALTSGWQLLAVRALPGAVGPIARAVVRLSDGP